MDMVTFMFGDDGSIPNNPNFPVLIYRAVFDDPGGMQGTFEHNEWTNSWVNGVFDYHHYHSNSHEVLGVINGSATLQLGGTNGNIVRVKTGDVIILPAGTGHRRLEASADFQVVGAYPEGQDYDTLTGRPEERPDNVKRIEQIGKPRFDPVFGTTGPFHEAWTKEENE